MTNDVIGALPRRVVETYGHSRYVLALVLIMSALQLPDTYAA